MSKPVLGINLGNPVTGLGQGLAQGLPGPGLDGSQRRFKFAPGQFNRVEVRRIGVQKQQPGPVSGHALGHTRHFMHPQIIQDDHVCWDKRWPEYLVEIGGKCRFIQVPVQLHNRFQALGRQGSHDGHVAPAAQRHPLAYPLPGLGAAVASGIAQVRARFIYKLETAYVFYGQGFGDGPAFFLPAAALALLLWAISAGHGLGPILAQPSHFTTPSGFFKFFFPSLTGMVGFWATLSLNIPDFTRYATSQRAQQVGQALGLPLPMTLFSFVGVAVTSATLLIYGTTIWDPVVLAGRFEGRWLVTGAMLAVALSTLATNIAANIVSPANDFANLAPQRISFRAGGYLTGVVGLLIFPWKLIADPSGFIFTWLVGYSALLGPIGGILITDYYLLRHQELSLNDLYQHEGRYTYQRGFNPVAMVALVLGIIPCVPGFLAAIGVLDKAAVWPWLLEVYNYAWFVGFFVAGTVYWLLMRGRLLAGGRLSFART